MRMRVGWWIAAAVAAAVAFPLSVVLAMSAVSRGSYCSHVSGATAARTLAFVSRNDESRRRRRRCERQRQGSCPFRPYSSSIVVFSSQGGGSSGNRNTDDNQGSYNLAKPVFDLYAARMVRGDALTKYNTLNQSEPLRINLLLTLTLFCLSLPWLSNVPDVSVVSQSSMQTAANAVPALDVPFLSSLSSSSLPMPSTTLVSLLSASASAFGMLTQCRARNRQLVRFEKEAALLDLPVQLPNSILADTPYTSRSTSIRSVLATSSFRRILVISGSVAELRQSLAQLPVLRRRLMQAQTGVVVLPCRTNVADSVVSPATTGQRQFVKGSEARIWQSAAAVTRREYSVSVHDGSSLLDNVDIDDDSMFESSVRFPWLLQASDLSAWAAFLDTLSETTSSSTFCWFGISSSGRSFGSGTTAPMWLQLFGRHLLPAPEMVDDWYDSKNTATSASNSNGTSTSSSRRSSMSNGSDGSDNSTTLLQHQERFYQALTQGNRADMAAIFTDCNATAVSNVVQQGGRLDVWDTCLADGARPDGLQIADCDVYSVSSSLPNVAYTTCIELTATGQTLLAVQEWRRCNATGTGGSAPSPGKNDDGAWQLVLHQTIPWTATTPAAGILMCDGRGCVSLVRQ